MKRRDFIKLSAALVGVTPVINGCETEHRVIPGSIIGASSKVGHMMRDHVFGEAPDITNTTTRNVVIVGGGVSGLSAARRLSMEGVSDIAILDLENHIGGNASCGGNAISKYPWGAHYVPIPNPDLKEYLEFLEGCNVITGRNDKQVPVYNEYYLCQDPEERLYINGAWQDGLVPNAGVSGAEQKQFRDFFAIMQSYRTLKGKDGKDAFAIPVDRSSKDGAFTGLDQLTMKQWLLQQNFDSKYLHDYVNYCTRDDFGTRYDSISAWAGIHYFAGRKGEAANAAAQDVLTWEQGNGFLVTQLQNDIKADYLQHALVIAVQQAASGIHIDYYDVASKTLKRIIAGQCILATPQFINCRLLKDKERMEMVQQHLEYAPWMVANLTVGALGERSGQVPCWDNVLHGAESLGYVDATHQQLGQKKDKRNLTYYLPLSYTDPKAARSKALKTSHAEWVARIVDDLKIVHPDIGQALEKVDIMVWGHAMAQPLPGMIHGDIRRELGKSIGNIHFAHTDLAGISIFEEAFYQGWHAAGKILDQYEA